MRRLQGFTSRLVTSWNAGAYTQLVVKRGAFILAATFVLVACGTSEKRVVVPRRMQQTDLVNAFDIARSLGLRVTTTQPFAVSALRMPSVLGVTPGPGSAVHNGGAVELTLTAGPIGSPAVLKSDPHYRVPNFVGKRAEVAVSWAGHHSMFWEIASLPPLHASKSSHLFDAYVVTGQTPKPGRILSQGRLVGRSYHLSLLTLTVAVR